MRHSQSQSGGDDSTLIQSGRDIIVHQSGITPTEAMEIAKSVVMSELEHYHTVARLEVERRCEEIRNELIERILGFNMEMLNAFRDPDVQALLGEAQASYARSGRDDVRGTLVDLVAARCQTQTGTLQASAIEHAVATVRKLSKASINALTLSFVVRRISLGKVNSLETLTKSVEKNWLPFTAALPEGVDEHSHLVALGCVRTDMMSGEIAEILYRRYPGMFQKGRSLDDLVGKFPEIHNVLDFFVPDPRDDSSFIIQAMDAEYARTILPSSISASVADRYGDHLTENRLGTDEISADLRSIGGPWPDILDAWSGRTFQSSMYPTTIGIAIAHSNWTNLTKSDAPLSEWLN